MTVLLVAFPLIHVNMCLFYCVCDTVGIALLVATSDALSRMKLLNSFISMLVKWVSAFSLLPKKDK